MVKWKIHSVCRSRLSKPKYSFSGDLRNIDARKSTFWGFLKYFNCGQKKWLALLQPLKYRRFFKDLLITVLFKGIESSLVCYRVTSSVHGKICSSTCLGLTFAKPVSIFLKKLSQFPVFQVKWVHFCFNPGVDKNPVSGSELPVLWLKKISLHSCCFLNWQGTLTLSRWLPRKFLNVAMNSVVFSIRCVRNAPKIMFLRVLICTYGQYISWVDGISDTGILRHKMSSSPQTTQVVATSRLHSVFQPHKESRINEWRQTVPSFQSPFHVKNAFVLLCGIRINSSILSRVSLIADFMVEGVRITDITSTTTSNIIGFIICEAFVIPIHFANKPYQLKFTPSYCPQSLVKFQTISHLARDHSSTSFSRGV